MTFKIYVIGRMNVLPSNAFVNVKKQYKRGKSLKTIFTDLVYMTMNGVLMCNERKALGQIQ